MKMFGAVVLLAVVVSINYYVPAMAKKAQAPDPTIMKSIPMLAPSSLVLVLLGIPSLQLFKISWLCEA